MVRPAKRFRFMLLKKSAPYSARRSSSVGSGESLFFIESALEACQKACADDPHDIAMLDEGYQQKTRSTALPRYELPIFTLGRVIGIRANPSEIISKNRSRFVECDAVLLRVARGLRAVPFKAFC